MKNVIKRSLSFLLAITLVFSSAYVGLSEVDFSSLFAVKAEAASSGKCGKNLTWTLDNNGTLTISGKGDMYDYYHQEGKYTPWCDMAPYIVTVVIKKGVIFKYEIIIPIIYTMLFFLDFVFVCYKIPKSKQK